MPEISFYVIRGNVHCGYILFGEYLGEFIQEFILLEFQQSHLRIYLKEIIKNCKKKIAVYLCAACDMKLSIASGFLKWDFPEEIIINAVEVYLTFKIYIN